MNTLTTIEASIDEPTVAAVAQAVFAQIKAIGASRRRFDLDSQAAVARQVLERLESVAAAKAFLGRADDTTETDNFGVFFPASDPRSEDERSVTLCWGYEDFDIMDPCEPPDGFATTHRLPIDFLGAVVDEAGDEGNALILAPAAARAVFGDEKVNDWIEAKIDYEVERAE